MTMHALSQVRSPATPVATRRGFLQCALGVALLSLAGSAVASEPPHTTTMLGQVLAVEQSSLVLCIGSRSGADVGQTLDVVRHVHGTRAPKSPHGFRRETVGQVRIAEIFDEHYSRAEIVSGSPAVNDTVELQGAR